MKGFKVGLLADRPKLRKLDFSKLTIQSFVFYPQAAPTQPTAPWPNKQDQFELWQHNATITPGVQVLSNMWRGLPPVNSNSHRNMLSTTHWNFTRGVFGNFNIIYWINMWWELKEISLCSHLLWKYRFSICWQVLFKGGYPYKLVLLLSSMFLLTICALAFREIPGLGQIFRIQNSPTVSNMG